MSEYDNFDNFDVMDQMLSNGGVAAPDKKDRNPKKKEKESSGIKPGKEKVAPGRSESTEKNLDFIEHRIYLTRKESILLKLTSVVSRKSMSAIVRESMSVAFKNMETELTAIGISNLESMIKNDKKS